VSTKATHSKAPKSALICELGADWLKIVRLEHGRSGIALAAAHMQALDPLQSVSADMLRSVLKEMGAADTPLYSCMPRQSVTFRALSLPSTKQDEVSDMIDLQVGKLTPYSKEEIVYDYLHGGSGGKGYTRVMLAIAQRSVLRGRYSLLEEAGARVSRMSISTEGVLSWYCNTHRAGARGEGTLVLDVDSGFTDVIVVEGNRLAFSRSVLIGAVRLHADSRGATDRLAREVSNSLSALSAEAPDVTVRQVVLTGAGVAISGLADALGTQLGLPVEVEDSLDAIRNLPAQPDLRSEAYRLTSMTAVVGMALAPQSLEFDLEPDSVRMRRELMLKARGLSKLGVLVMTLMMLLSTYGISKVLLRKARLQNLEQEVVVTEEKARKLTDRMKMVALVHERVKVDRSVIRVIKDVHDRVPNEADVDFKSFGYDEALSTIKLQGTGRTTRDIRALVKALENSPILRGVQEGQTKFVRKSGRYDFTLQCAVEKSNAG